MSSRNSNSFAPKRRVDYDADELITRLPPAIRHFVLYEVSVQAYLPSIIEKVEKLGTIKALELMRANLARDALKVYGESYPQNWTRPLSAEDLDL